MELMSGYLVIMKSNKKYFLGWNNLKSFVKEVINTLSDKPSRFSKKRVQSWMLFINAWLASIVWFVYHFKTMDIGTLIAYMSTLLAYAGYQVYQTQKEKKDLNKTNENTL